MLKINTNSKLLSDFPKADFLQLALFEPMHQRFRVRNPQHPKIKKFAAQFKRTVSPCRYGRTASQREQRCKK